MIIAEAPSPNFGPRAAGKTPRLLILHYTDTKTAFEALQILQSKERQVSAHYLVDEAGQATRMVPEEMRAWHAGKSFWEGETDVNSVSIGIEIQNPGHTYGYVRFPEPQVKAVAELCRGIIARHRILANHVLAHSDIAPERKRDPGELFPWHYLSGQGVGLWPKIDEDDKVTPDQEAIVSLLGRYGYDTKIDFKILLTAFQRHFEPEVFEVEDEGIPTRRTIPRLESLVKQKLALRPRAA
jgi:N-acetylmuramoyl-L-alanine amidase